MIEVSDDALDYMARRIMENAARVQWAAQLDDQSTWILLPIALPLEYWMPGIGQVAMMPMRTIRLDIDRATKQIIIPHFNIVREMIRQAFAEPVEWPYPTEAPERPANEVFGDWLKRTAGDIGYKQEMGE